MSSGNIGKGVLCHIDPELIRACCKAVTDLNRDIAESLPVGLRRYINVVERVYADPAAIITEVDNLPPCQFCNGTFRIGRIKGQIEGITPC